MPDIKLYNEDCLQTINQIGKESVDLIVTDPPYNLGNFMKRRDVNFGRIRDNFFVLAGWDNMEYDEWEKSMSDFLDGLHAALCEDPDIIIVGEIRNADSVRAVINAAESGHLVFSTLHGGNVIEAIDRIAQYFPNDQHSIIRAQLANCFEGIICQRLFPRKDGAGRIAAFEVLLSTPATKALVRDNPAELPGYMFARFGMGVMDDSIKELKHKNLI